MKYWDDLNHKFGFGDGGSQPPDAVAAREVYLRAVNALAEAHGSEHRIIAWNRPGMHNGCMVVAVSAEFFGSLTDQQRFITGPEDYPPNAANPRQDDSALAEAVCAAADLDLDDYVITRIEIDTPGLERAIRTAVQRTP